MIILLEYIDEESGERKSYAKNIDPKALPHILDQIDEAEL